MKRLIAIAWLLCIFVAVNSYAADKKIKRQVLKNCDAAERRMSTLAQNERRDFADYLARALALDLPDEFHDIQIWQGFDPLAEYEVKGCAARLAMSLAPESLVTLPKLLILLDDPLAPEELKELAQEAALQIAFASRFYPISGVDQVAVAEMFSLSGEYAVAARAEIIEWLADEAKRILLWQLAICQETQCAPLLDEFTRISSSLSPTDAQWRDLLHAKEPSVRAALVRAVVSMPVKVGVLEIALELIDDPALEVQKEIASLLKRVSSIKQKTFLSKQAQGLAQHFASHLSLQKTQ